MITQDLHWSEPWPSEEYPSGKEMTSEELKQAIVSMMLRKDEVEERNRSLQQHLEKEMMKSASLRLQLEDLKRAMSSKDEENCVALNGLKRPSTPLTPNSAPRRAPPPAPGAPPAPPRPARFVTA
ncbi:sorting nexin-29-like isoform X3 [Xenia sp. Carnegie-2017]|uniref:sorting nexin-29-like isoform X3 n=1 Tax=Xenia sp. Carnegie-2017 TaxID=2897299 RepID=UPI001F03399F|nr:sorting nexin-29-like isoform X3 [Xenia sp. Carnegie-2017]